MYPVPPTGLLPSTGNLAITGLSIGLAALVGVVVLFVGLVMLRAATVRIDPDARR